MNEYIEYGFPLFGLIVFILFGIYFFRSLKELKKAFLESGKKWPFHSQGELNKMAHTKLPRSYEMMWENMRSATRIIFKMRTDKPVILKPLRSIRRMLIIFCVLPFFVAFILFFVFIYIYV